MVTREELLDELLGMASEVGRLGNEVAGLEHRVAWGSKSEKADLRGTLRRTKAKLTTATEALARARARFLSTTENK